MVCFASRRGIKGQFAWRLHARPLGQVSGERISERGRNDCFSVPNILVDSSVLQLAPGAERSPRYRELAIVTEALSRRRLRKGTKQLDLQVSFLAQGQLRRLLTAKYY